MKKKRKLRYRRRNHGRTGTQDLRGNSQMRKYRKLWLLKTFGDGKKVPCIHCGKKLDYDTVTADRIIPGCKGGRYGHDNIQPACKKCNDSRNTFSCELTDYEQEAAAMKKAMFGSIKRNPHKTRYWTTRERKALKLFQAYRRRTA